MQINRFGNFWQRCCWERIKWWFVISPLLTNVSASLKQTWTWTTKIVFFQSCCIPSLENDTALACYIFDTHQPIFTVWQHILSATSLPKINKIGLYALKLQCATSVSFLRHRVVVVVCNAAETLMTLFCGLLPTYPCHRRWSSPAELWTWGSVSWKRTTILSWPRAIQRLNLWR